MSCAARIHPADRRAAVPLATDRRARPCLAPTATLLLNGVVGKQLSIYPRQDVYVERQRPTWSYRTAILQVGKAQGESEYRSFLAFDLSGIARSAYYIVRQGEVRRNRTQRAPREPSTRTIRATRLRCCCFCVRGYLGHDIVISDKQSLRFHQFLRSWGYQVRNSVAGGV